MDKRIERIEALRTFMAAANNLLSNWDDETMTEGYPFDKSFDDLSWAITEWVESATEKLTQL